jgi:hypothetical protein
MPNPIYGTQSLGHEILVLEKKLAKEQERHAKSVEETRRMTERVIELNKQVSGLSVANAELRTEITKKEQYAEYLEGLCEKYGIDPLAGEKIKDETVRKLNIESEEVDNA